MKFIALAVFIFQFSAAIQQNNNRFNATLKQKNSSKLTVAKNTLLQPRPIKIDSKTTKTNFVPSSKPAIADNLTVNASIATNSTDVIVTKPVDSIAHALMDLLLAISPFGPRSKLYDFIASYAAYQRLSAAMAANSTSKAVIATNSTNTTKSMSFGKKGTCFAFNIQVAIGFLLGYCFLIGLSVAAESSLKNLEHMKHSLKKNTLLSEKPNVKWDDIVGLEGAKGILRKTV